MRVHRPLYLAVAASLAPIPPLMDKPAAGVLGQKPDPPMHVVAPTPRHW